MNDILKIAEAFTHKIGNYTVSTLERNAIARAILNNAIGKSATALIMALRNLYGTSFLVWEPETLWLTLEKDGIILSKVTRDKIQAAITLFSNPAFFWDNLVFQRTVQAFNEIPYDPEALQECEVPLMCWAVYDAILLRTQDLEDKSIPEFDEDVQQYVAVCLQRAGYVYPPEQLTFSFKSLLKLLPRTTEKLALRVKNGWEHIDKKQVEQRKFTEDVLGVQLSKLAACYLYVSDMMENMAADVLELEQEVIV